MNDFVAIAANYLISVLPVRDATINGGNVVLNIKRSRTHITQIMVQFDDVVMIVYDDGSTVKTNFEDLIDRIPKPRREKSLTEKLES